MTSFSRWSRLAVSSVARRLAPVMFPPGRARLAMKPAAIGSPTAAMTIGMVLVVFRAASVDSVPAVKMTSTLLWTRSAASAGKRLACPSVYRNSRRTFRPSVHPRS